MLEHLAKVDVVTDLQFGSTGKGQVVASLVHTHPDRYRFILKNGVAQAGHTVAWQDSDAPVDAPTQRAIGEHALILHYLPSLFYAWREFWERVKENPPVLVLGPATILDPNTFINELKQIHRAVLSHFQSLPFDQWPRFTLLLASTIKVVDHSILKDYEKGLVERIGSTGTGVGSARARVILREALTLLEVLTQDREDQPESHRELKRLLSSQKLTPFRFQLIDYHTWIQGVLMNPDIRLLIEGTQGYGLSLHGRYYPYATSTQITTSSLLGDLFIPPQAIDRVIGVMRTWPIRVGGNSGPMRMEVDWNILRAFNPFIRPEKTTVTQRTRRIGYFDLTDIVEAILVNGVTDIVVNFLNYMPGWSEEFLHLLESLFWWVDFHRGTELPSSLVRIQFNDGRDERH